MDKQINKHEYYMSMAIKEAKKAEKINEIPVGAVIVLDDKIIAKGHNRKEKDMLCTKHAEIIAIEKASKKLKNWRLENCSIYVTLEPCLMCTGTLISSRIKNVYYGVKDKKLGSIESKIKISDFNYYHKMNIIGGILKDDCKKLILDFFQKLRKEKKVNKNGRII